MTSKEKIIARLNKAFDLNIKPDHPIKTHCNPRGYMGQWSWSFFGTVFGNNFSGNIGSYVPIGVLLKSKQLVMIDDGCADYTVYPGDAGYRFDRDIRNGTIQYERQ